jgi:hypothetical protein
MRHPAEFYFKALIIQNPTWTDEQILKKAQDWGILSPDEKYLPFLRAEIPPPPPNFDSANFLDRPSMRYLREQGVYEYFRSPQEMAEAWDLMASPEKRLVAEQLVLSRVDLKIPCQKINKKHGWFLTEDGIKTFAHYFWNPSLLTFDEWGRYLYGRSALYERHMALLHGNTNLAFFHLRIEQTVESKAMIQRAQEIAYFAMEEVNLKPGTGADKIKAISVLAKAVVECHEALSTSDMALKDVLKQFERFRVEHPHSSPPDIRILAPAGNYTGGGAAEKDKLPN